MPLKDVRILDLTHVWAGPLGVRFLSDLGAEVIKIEAPYGRGPREYPSDPLGLADMLSFGSQYFGGIKVASDDIYNFGTNVVFLFHEMDTIAMTHANRSLWGWSERHLFWCYRRNPKFFSSKGIAP